MELIKGTIIKGIAGFYYVRTADDIVRCKARGVFKNKGITPLTGDEVMITLPEGPEDEGVVAEIMPRKNSFIRPPVANVDCFIVVVSMVHPKPNLMIIDKFTAMAEKNHAEVLICLNKSDEAKAKQIEKIENIYKDIYPVIRTSGITGQGLDELEVLMRGRRCAFAGPSGVGKSTIINKMIPEADMDTGSISKKTKRGRHTTRHVEIFESEGGGSVYDTPGFTSFDISSLEEEELASLFPEIERLRTGCRFDDCRHMKEPGCAVVQALEKGEIPRSRYDSYLAQMEEIRRSRQY